MECKAPGMQVAGKFELTWMDGAGSMLEKDTLDIMARVGTGGCAIVGHGYEGHI